MRINIDVDAPKAVATLATIALGGLQDTHAEESDKPDPLATVERFAEFICTDHALRGACTTLESVAALALAIEQRELDGWLGRTLAELEAQHPTARALFSDAVLAFIAKQTRCQNGATEASSPHEPPPR